MSVIGLPKTNNLPIDGRSSLPRVCVIFQDAYACSLPPYLTGSAPVKRTIRIGIIAQDTVTGMRKREKNCRLE